MVEQPIGCINPEDDWQVAIRRPCPKCRGTGQERVGLAKPSWMHCLMCGSTGYLNHYMRVRDLADIMDWKRRDATLGGA